jgi:hypothetical protein
VLRVDTALLVVGGGPAALVAAKVAGACGQPCLLAGHALAGDTSPVVLEPAAVTVLEAHGLVDVLRPHLASVDPLAIAPRDFEEVVKQHCVADLNVAVYDAVDVVDRVADGVGLRGVLTDGSSRWDLHADVVVDTRDAPAALSAAITAGAAAAEAAIRTLRAGSGT